MLVLVALVAGLVAPVVTRGLAAARERTTLAGLTALLEGLPLRTFREGTPQSYDAAALAQMLGGLPAGWTLRLDAPLAYSGAGVASGGELRLVMPDRAPLLLRVLPVSGEVEEPDQAS